MAYSVLANAVVNIVTNNSGFKTGLTGVHSQLSSFIMTASTMMGIPFISKPLVNQLNVAKAAFDKSKKDIAYYKDMIAQGFNFKKELAASKAAFAIAKADLRALQAAAKGAASSNVVVAAGFVAFGVKASMMASQLNTELDLTVQTFGHMSSAIYKTADAMQSKWGIVRQEILAVTTAFGEMFNKIGLGGKAGAEMSSSLAQLARDLASNRGISFGEAAGQVRGAMGGSGEFFDEARVEARAFQMGLMRLHQPMTDTARAFVRQQLLMESLAYVEGQAALQGPRLSDEIAKLSGNFGRISTELGSAVLPIFQGLVYVLNLVVGGIASFIEWLHQGTLGLMDWYDKLVGAPSLEMDRQIRADEMGRFQAENQAKIRSDLALAQAMHTQPRMAVHTGFEEFRKRLLQGASGGQFALQKQLVQLAKEQNQRLQQIANNTMPGGAKGPLPSDPAFPF